MSGWLDPYGAEDAAGLQHILLAPGRGRSHATADDALRHFQRAHGAAGPTPTPPPSCCAPTGGGGGPRRPDRRLEEGGLLDDPDLDELAVRFLAGPTLPVWARRADDETVEVQLGERPRSGRRPWQRTPRMITRPLRRGATARALTQRAWEPSWRCWALPSRLDAADAAVIVAGMADAAPRLAPADGTTVVELALSWGSNVARLAGLRQLAEHGDLRRALVLARSDPTATVRRWAETVSAQPRLVGGAETDVAVAPDAADPPPEGAAASPPGTARPRPPTASAHDGQATLFG